MDLVLERSRKVVRLTVRNREGCDLRAVAQVAELVAFLVAWVTQGHADHVDEVLTPGRGAPTERRTRPRSRSRCHGSSGSCRVVLTRAGKLPARARSLRLRITVTVMPTTMNHRGIPSNEQDRPDHGSPHICCRSRCPVTGIRGGLWRIRDHLRLEQGQPEVGQPA